MTSAQAASGKTHGDENFPVASRVIAARHRPAILAFYHFVRAGDDVADHPTLPPDAKLALLDRLEATLLGRDDAEPVALPLRTELAARKLDPRHAQDLLAAFRLDVTKRRYADWAELIHYCSLSAMPVGRFVLDVHGESEATWPANDALCAALQIINHLQDCGKDFRALDRVYIPLDALARARVDIADLGEARATPALRACLADLVERTAALLRDGAALSPGVQDFRLRLETAAIAGLAQRIIGLLRRRDPLSETVHLAKPQMAATSLGAMMVAALRSLPLGGAAARTPLAAKGEP